MLKLEGSHSTSAYVGNGLIVLEYCSLRGVLCHIGFAMGGFSYS